MKGPRKDLMPMSRSAERQRIVLLFVDRMLIANHCPLFAIRFANNLPVPHRIRHQKQFVISNVGVMFSNVFIGVE